MFLSTRTRWLRNSWEFIVSNLLEAKRYGLPNLKFCTELMYYMNVCNNTTNTCIAVEKQTRFIVMGNVFCSEYRIHKRFDLKGSSHGRTTDKLRKEIDETTTLKDLDLSFAFRLEQSWFQELKWYRIYVLVESFFHF